MFFPPPTDQAAPHTPTLHTADQAAPRAPTSQSKAHMCEAKRDDDEGKRDAWFEAKRDACEANFFLDVHDMRDAEPTHSHTESTSAAGRKSRSSRGSMYEVR